MKRLIYNIKRFTYSLKVRWRIRKTPKFMRKFAFWWHMAAYDTAQALKGVRPMAKDTLDSMADLVGIERQEGETDEELRKRIIEIVAATWNATSGRRRPKGSSRKNRGQKEP